jgi:heptosyltransferase-3
VSGVKILFITHTRIGDAVLSSGILRHLIETRPEARFTIVCGPLAAPLFADVPRVDRIIVMVKQPFDSHWFKLWREVRKVRWDLVVDLRRSLLSYFISARERRVLGPADDSIHRVRYLSSVLGLGAPAEPFLYVSPAHQAAARALIPDGAPVLAVSPVAATDAKTWPAERFAAVITAATAPGGFCAGWRVALFGAPADRAAVQPLVTALPHDVLLIFDEPDLLTVYAALGRCGRFIGNDSGLAHLAAAAGVPALALFGPTDPVRYAPRGVYCRTVRAPDGAIASLDAETVLTALRGLNSHSPPSKGGLD